MNYNSVFFLLFYTLVFVLYYTLFRKYQKQLLCAASVCFYCIAGFRNLVFVLFVSAVTFFCAKKISRTTKKNASRILKLDFLLVLGIFIFLRYFNFMSTTANHVMHMIGLEGDPIFLHLIVPLGLSYYTFTNVGYILDVYWKRIPAEESFLNFFLFTIYFPHIIQGPISKYQNLAPQFQGCKSFDYDRVTSGLQLMLWGYFKKLVIADRLNIFVSAVYDQYQSSGGAMLVLATLLYSVQIYADFSGCMDIVGGVSETLGIHLEQNFNHPYFARTIPDFWRRWHMTLCTWFKDYVYYPISISGWMKKSSKYIRKTRGSLAGRKYLSSIPTLAVWVLTGLWHGAAWNFIAWGMFHAILMTSGILFAETIKNINKKLRINEQAYSWKLFQMVRTYLLCSVGRVFFRAYGIKNAVGIFHRMVTSVEIWQLFDGTVYQYGLDRPNFLLALLSIAVLWAVSMLQERFAVRRTLAEQNIAFRWAVCYAAILSILIFGIYGPGYDASAFIYNQF